MDFRVGGRSGGHVLKEDSVHVSGDRGVPALVVRQDTVAALGADGDYVPITTDSSGQLRVSTVEVLTAGGLFYSDNFTAPDAASEVILGSERLHSCIIRNTHATYEAELRENGGDWVELPAASSLEYFIINIGTIHCKAQTDGENPVLDVSGAKY